MANMNFGVNILPKANNAYTLGNSDYKWNIFANTINGTSVSTLLSNMITDIQIDGTSIISNGIATIPLASTTNYGLVKIGGGLHLEDNYLYINEASLSLIKAGTTYSRAIVPSHQHESVFYGLAKAAGDSTQSASSNAVGVYTDDAKAAIQTMLNVPSSNNPIFTGSFSLGRKANTTIGSYSFACGYNNEASGAYSYAIGDDNVASSQFSFASGNGTQASGWGSHTEGQFTQATDQLAHAEGRSTIASGYAAHAEGFQTTSANMGSHAEGYMTIAYSFGSHAEGSDTIARGVGTHAFGTSNVPNTAEEWIASTSYEIDDIIEYNNELFQCKTANNDATFDSSKWLGSKGTYIETVGNGINGSNRSNARALDWNGNERLNGTLYVNCNSDSTGGIEVATKTNATSSIAGLMSSTDKIKLDGITTMTGATSSANGTSGLVPAPTTTDVDKFLAGDGTYKSGGLPMVILSYGSSTWADFEAAYNNNVIVYCRASSNNNPATGSQTRMAFMAYVNNAASPTNVEFQYYRSVNSHSDTQMGDQVFVYKLDKTSGWSVTTREASIKQIKADTGTALGVSWSSNVVTLTNTMTAADMPMSSSDATTVGSAISELSGQITNLGKRLAINTFTATTDQFGQFVSPVDQSKVISVMVTNRLNCVVSFTGSTTCVVWARNNGSLTNDYVHVLASVSVNVTILYDNT